MVRRLLLASLFAFLAAAGAAPAQADTGWTITSFLAATRINPDGTVAVTETIKVDFGDLQKHGIYRDIPVEYAHDQQYDRVVEVSGVQVRGAAGAAVPFSQYRNGVDQELKIGDPNRTVSGSQTYVITYSLRGALNSFSDHDELYWNATGDRWPVPIGSATAQVQAPAGSLQRVTCFQGAAGSTEPCQASNVIGGQTALFNSTRALQPGEGLTFAAAIASGTVPVPAPILVRRARTLPEMFELSITDLVGFGLVLGAGIGLLAWAWWRTGRDHQYRSAYYTNHDPATPDEIVPLAYHRPVVVEFGPPDNLRPAQLGLILDEQPDKKDVTATIVDLACRGFLKITELAGKGPHGRPDYTLTQVTPIPDLSQLQVYERTVYYGLFTEGRSEVKVSELRGTFVMPLAFAERDLLRDAMQRRWFNHSPANVRLIWIGVGIATMVAGGGLAFVLGQATGDGLVGIALVLVGIATAVFSGRMPSRTAAGHEVLFRTLGFRLYMTTAERYQQQFAEREKIFTSLLPYAIVFGCVDRWAHAFSDIDASAAAGGWYAGAGAFNALAFSSSLQQFSSAVATSTAPTVAASSGGSGFSGGGFSGGGFGGGGGGSW